MNKKVFSSMLILCIAFLLFCCVLKFFFPEEFILFVENDKLIKIGTFIDSHNIIKYICYTITSFITTWLFMCACKKSWYLNWKEILIVLGFIIGARLVNFIDPNIATHISIVTFFLVPLICKFDLKIATIVYTVHGISQVLSLGIRDLPMYMTSVNFVTLFVCGLETYIWLILCYIVFNYNKERR
jgi:hypothetical protein